MAAMAESQALAVVQKEEISEDTIEDGKDDEDNDWGITVHKPASSGTSSKSGKKKGKKKDASRKKNSKKGVATRLELQALKEKADKPVDLTEKGGKFARHLDHEDVVRDFKERHQSREFQTALYKDTTRLSEDALASRFQYAPAEGVWNAQTDVWLREAQSSGENWKRLQIIEAKKEYDREHSTMSFNISGGLLSEHDPFHVESALTVPVSKKSDKKKAHSRDEVLAPDALSRLEEDTGKSHRNGGSDDDPTAAAEQQSKEDAEVESGSMSRRPGVSPIDQNRKKGKKKRDKRGRNKMGGNSDSGSSEEEGEGIVPLGDKEDRLGYLYIKPTDRQKLKEGDDLDGEEDGEEKDDDGEERGGDEEVNESGVGGSRNNGDGSNGVPMAEGKKKKKKRKKKKKQLPVQEGEQGGDNAPDSCATTVSRGTDEGGVSASRPAEVTSAVQDHLMDKIDPETGKPLRSRERVRDEKLARIAAHTPWDRVANRLRDLHDLEVTPRECCRRFVKTYKAWEDRDKKMKEEQLKVQKRRGGPNAKGRGDAVLATCCLSGRSVSCAETIINMGGDIDNRSSSDGATPLLRACEGGNPHVVKLLLDKGADRTAETRDGRNAMHIAGQFKWPDLVEVLLDEGAPLCTLRACGKCKLIQKLIQRKRERAGQGVGRGKGRKRSAAEKQAAIDAALKAFEQEFGTFEEEVAKEGRIDDDEGGERNGDGGIGGLDDDEEYVRLMQSMMGGAGN